MARIAGVDIPNDKPVAYSLAYIYGIGIPTGKKICADAKVDPTKRVKDLTEAELTAIRSKVAEYKVEGDLRREVKHQEITRNRLLSRNSSQAWFTMPWPTNKDQCTYSQRST